MKTHQKMIACFVCLLSFQSLIFAQNTADAKSEIYSKLKDRRCSMSLEKCDCPDAKEMKAYIDAFLETGLDKDEIFYKVAKKFSLNVILDTQTKTKIEERLIKEAGGKRAQIVFERTSLDFGEVNKKQGKINKTLKIYNKGNVNLIITNIRVSCDCVTASLKTGKIKSPYFGVVGAGPGWQAKIEPGKSAELEVMLDLNHSSITIGKQIRDIFISSNDPVNSESTIRAEVEVKE